MNDSETTNVSGATQGIIGPWKTRESEDWAYVDQHEFDWSKPRSSCLTLLRKPD